MCQKRSILLRIAQKVKCGGMFEECGIHFFVCAYYSGRYGGDDSVARNSAVDGRIFYHLKCAGLPTGLPRWTAVRFEERIIGDVRGGGKNIGDDQWLRARCINGDVSVVGRNDYFFSGRKARIADNGVRRIFHDKQGVSLNNFVNFGIRKPLMGLGAMDVSDGAGWVGIGQGLWGQDR